mmetsp:Transcript_10213/g.15428  ORF Transcript_10213/g.15428 Transcript_10213/m.15428 type:complete len:86 (-) Transcript_10213:82-339(-)
MLDFLMPTLLIFSFQAIGAFFVDGCFLLQMLTVQILVLLGGSTSDQTRTMPAGSLIYSSGGGFLTFDFVNRNYIQGVYLVALHFI